jgi:hypothetical protein
MVRSSFVAAVVILMVTMALHVAVRSALVVGRTGWAGGEPVVHSLRQCNLRRLSGGPGKSCNTHSPHVRCPPPPAG